MYVWKNDLEIVLWKRKFLQKMITVLFAKIADLRFSLLGIRREIIARTVFIRCTLILTRATERTSAAVLWSL
jgi:hypothetical protein